MKVIKALYSLLPASSAKVTPRDTDTHHRNPFISTASAPILASTSETAHLFGHLEREKGAAAPGKFESLIRISDDGDLISIALPFLPCPRLPDRCDA